jgi:large subunit ribosomal protein L19
MATLMQIVEQSQLRDNIPDFRVGCTVRVNYRVTEGNKERIQAYEGIVIARHCKIGNSKATFTVRKMTQGYGVERIFPLHSPRIESIEVVREGRVRRAKLYYMRDRKGKAARIKERMNSRISRLAKAQANA